MLNGILRYTTNLDRKLRRGAILIEEYKGKATGEKLKKELMKMWYKHSEIIPEMEVEDLPIKYHWKHKHDEGRTFHSAYPKLLLNFNKQDWISINE